MKHHPGLNILDDHALPTGDDDLYLQLDKVKADNLRTAGARRCSASDAKRRRKSRFEAPEAPWPVPAAANRRVRR